MSLLVENGIVRGGNRSARDAGRLSSRRRYLMDEFRAPDEAGTKAVEQFFAGQR